MSASRIDSHDKMRARFVYEFSRRNSALATMVADLRRQLLEKFPDATLSLFEAEETMRSNHARWLPKNGNNFPYSVVKPATDFSSFVRQFVKRRGDQAYAAPFNWYHLAVFSAFPAAPWPIDSEKEACEHLARALKPQIHNRRGLSDVSFELHSLLEVIYKHDSLEKMPHHKFAEEWVKHRSEDGLWAATFLLDFEQCSSKEMVGLFSEWVSGIEGKRNKDTRRHRSRQVGDTYLPFELAEALETLRWVENIGALTTKNLPTKITFVRYEIAAKLRSAQIGLRSSKPIDIAKVKGGEIPAKRRAEKIRFVRALIDWMGLGGTPPRYR